jgi:hypothetical protein
LDTVERANNVGRLNVLIARRLVFASYVVRYGLVLSGSAMAAGAVFMDAAPGGIPWNRVVGLLGVVLAFVGGVWNVMVEPATPAALEEARLALEESRSATAAALDLQRRFTDEVRILRQDHQQLRQLNALAHILRESVQRAVLTKAELSVKLDSMLKAASRSMLACMHCSGGERWTITIFCHERGYLEIVSHCRADRHEEDQAGRHWAENEGYCGAAWSGNHELVLSNAQAPDALAVLNIPDSKKQPEDSIRYRSVAAIPVGIANMPRPWGVVVGTSDQLGRFDSDDTAPGARSAEAVRILAGAVAIVVTAHNGLTQRKRNGVLTHST